MSYAGCMCCVCDCYLDKKVIALSLANHSIVV